MKETIDFENDFIRTETEDSIILKAKRRNEDGFLINITFTKNQEEHEEAMEAIEEFFIREIL
ncbi:hypothetical protein ACT8ZR_18385 [Neobacillus sp. M.A.Huq-85]